MRSGTSMYFCSNHKDLILLSLPEHKMFQTVNLALHPTPLRQQSTWMFLCHLVTEEPQDSFWPIFFTGSPCISYLHNLRLCENQQKKKDGVLYVKSWTWVFNQQGYILNDLSPNFNRKLYHILWAKSSLEISRI